VIEKGPAERVPLPFAAEALQDIVTGVFLLGIGLVVGSAHETVVKAAGPWAPVALAWYEGASLAVLLGLFAFGLTGLFACGLGGACSPHTLRRGRLAVNISLAVVLLALGTRDGQTGNLNGVAALLLGLTGWPTLSYFRNRGRRIAPGATLGDVPAG
jgi:hypothetical protein